MKRVDVRKLGDELQAEATASSSPGSVRSVTITWRAGRFVAGLSASGLDPDPSIEAATALARKQLARIQRAD